MNDINCESMVLIKMMFPQGAGFYVIKFELETILNSFLHQTTSNRSNRRIE